MKEIIFATGNKGKLKEVQKIFEGTGFKILSLYDLGDVPVIPEDGDTYEENALIKARAIYSIYNRPVIADDSGLSVEQLEGRPGVFSARYAGENCTYDDNNRKVLNELERFPEPHQAKFVCCAVFYDGSEPIFSLGELPGRIIKQFKGVNGFGFDPIFLPDGHDITLAEMDIEKKNELSHRAIAFRKLKEMIADKC